MANWYVVVQGTDGTPYLKVGNVKTINISFESLLDINQKIRNPQTGVEVKDRKWMLKTYPQCFIASELVEWMLKQKITETREQAVGLSSYLVDKQCFHAVNSEHKFKDEDLYITFDDLETSLKNITESKAKATTRVSTPAKPSLNTLIKQALSSQPGTGNFMPTNAGPQCRVCKYELNEKWNFCPNCATHVNRDLDVLDTSQKLIKEQAEKLQQVQGADTLISNLQTQLDDLRKQNDDLKAKLQDLQSKPFAVATPSTFAQLQSSNDQSTSAQQSTLTTQQTPVQSSQPVTVAPTPVTPTPTQPTSIVQPTLVAREPEPVKEEPKVQQEEPKTQQEGQRSATFVMPQPKLIARDTPPTSVAAQSTQYVATTPQRGGWTTSAPSSNSGSLHSSNEASTNNNFAANSTTATNSALTTTSVAPTAATTSTPASTSGNSSTGTPAVNPQPAASGWTKARIAPSNMYPSSAAPKGFVAQPSSSATTTTTSTTTTTTTVTQQQVTEPVSAPLNKEPLPKQAPDVEIIKSTYGKKAVVKQIPTVETKIKSDAELGIDSSNFNSIVSSQFSHITGPISAIITGTVQRPETLGSAKLATLFQIDVFRGQYEWTVFRRLGQFKDLDKSWKNRKVKVMPLPVFSKKTDHETKREGIEKYLHNLLMNDDTALHPLLVNFLLPIQMDDTKPKKMDGLNLN